MPASAEPYANAAAGHPANAMAAAETIFRGSTEAMTASNAAATTAFQDPTKAYQDMAARNSANLTGAMHALSAVKNPAEFAELQQKLIKDGVQAAVSDSQNIAHLTAAVFTSAFEPVKKQVEGMYSNAAR
jgi:hypothetical protein